MEYREPLPEGCPPETAEEIRAPRTVYRLVESTPPTEADFQSHRAKHPNRAFHVSECQARGLSVVLDQVASRKLLKLPNFRGWQVCRLDLLPGAGQIEQTGQRSHHTWWPLADYDIFASCHMDQ